MRIKKSTQNQKESKVSVLSTCSEDSGTPRTLSSKQIELVDGPVRERERNIIPEGNTQNSALVRIEGEPDEIAYFGNPSLF
jgi:hypothetical protein